MLLQKVATYIGRADGQRVEFLWQLVIHGNELHKLKMSSVLPTLSYYYISDAYTHKFFLLLLLSHEGGVVGGALVEPSCCSSSSSSRETRGGGWYSTPANSTSELSWEWDCKERSCSKLHGSLYTINKTDFNTHSQAHRVHIALLH